MISFQPFLKHKSVISTDTKFISYCEQSAPLCPGRGSSILLPWQHLLNQLSTNASVHGVWCTPAATLWISIKQTHNYGCYNANKTPQESAFVIFLESANRTRTFFPPWQHVTLIAERNGCLLQTQTHETIKHTNKLTNAQIFSIVQKIDNAFHSINIWRIENHSLPTSTQKDNNNLLIIRIITDYDNNTPQCNSAISRRPLSSPVMVMLDLGLAIGWLWPQRCGLGQNVKAKTLSRLQHSPHWTVLLISSYYLVSDDLCSWVLCVRSSTRKKTEFHYFMFLSQAFALWEGLGLGTVTLVLSGVALLTSPVCTDVNTKDVSLDVQSVYGDEVSLFQAVPRVLWSSCDLCRVGRTEDSCSSSACAFTASRCAKLGCGTEQN